MICTVARWFMGTTDVLVVWGLTGIRWFGSLGKVPGCWEPMPPYLAWLWCGKPVFINPWGSDYSNGLWLEANINNVEGSYVNQS